MTEHELKPDATKPLRDLLAEVDALRSEAAGHGSMWRVLTMHLALHQLQHGPLEWKSSEADWDAVLKLIDNRRLALTSSGVVHLSTDGGGLLSEPFNARQLEEAKG